MLSIAETAGFFWETIWNHSANSALKTLRGDPAVLHPGDEVVIPDKRLKEEACAVNTRHRYRKKGTPAKLRMVVERDDHPLANKHYVLTIDGVTYEGDTDNTGFFEISIPPNARTGRLEVADMVFELTLGALDPIDQVSGAQARLQNLGFFDGPLDGLMSEALTAAITEFQSFIGLDPTGELDDDTRGRLFGRQDEIHDTGPADEENVPEDEPDQGNDTADDGDQADGDSDPEEDQDDTGETEIEIPEDESDAPA